MAPTETKVNFQTAVGNSKQKNTNEGKVLIGNGLTTIIEINTQTTAGSATQGNENKKVIEVGNLLISKKSKKEFNFQNGGSSTGQKVISFQTPEDSKEQKVDPNKEVQIENGDIAPIAINVQIAATGKIDTLKEDVKIGNRFKMEPKSQAHPVGEGSSTDPKKKVIINFQMAKNTSVQRNKNNGDVMIGNGHKNLPKEVIINGPEEKDATRENENKKGGEVGDKKLSKKSRR